MRNLGETFLRDLWDQLGSLLPCGGEVRFRMDSAFVRQELLRRLQSRGAGARSRATRRGGAVWIWVALMPSTAGNQRVERLHAEKAGLAEALAGCEVNEFCEKSGIVALEIRGGTRLRVPTGVSLPRCPRAGGLVRFLYKLGLTTARASNASTCRESTSIFVALHEEHLLRALLGRTSMAPMRVSSQRIACILVSALILPLSSAAQGLGPLTWQLQPYCNVITLNVTPNGPGFRLEGFDDQCGAARRAPVAGTAIPNPDGTIAFTFLSVTGDGRGSLTAVTMNANTFGGPWSDSGGNSGTFVFGIRSPGGGPPRPTALVTAAALAPQSVTTEAIADGAIGAADVNATQVQLRLRGTCPRGQFAIGASDAGTMGCNDGDPGPGVALGEGALASNAGSQNVAVGGATLLRNSTGQFNTGVGSVALFNNLTGSDNTAIGIAALSSNIDGSRNIAIGRFAGSSFVRGADDNIVIGHTGGSRDSSTIRIGIAQTRTFIAGIRGQSPEGTGEQFVVIDSNGQLGTIASSRRFKEDIADMGTASAGLLALRPVTFRYKQASADGSRPISYGLIAEEVAAVYPDLVVRNEAGEVETVQYHKLTAMLLNELQRQERAIDALRGQIEALQGRLATLEDRR